MNSIWQNTSPELGLPSLGGEVRTDILIIGGGVAGVLCAYFLDRAGADYRLVEAKTVGSGVTDKSTAKITAQHGLLYHRLLKEWGAERAKLYLEANRRAVGQYRALCGGLDCGWQEQPAYVFSRSSRDRLLREVEALAALGMKVPLARKASLPFPVAGTVSMEGQGQLHPLQFLRALAKDLRVYEHTKVQGLSPGTALTDHGVIRANKIVIATHFPILNKHGLYPLKLYQSRSYVLALAHAPLPDGMYVEDKDNGLSFRRCGDLLLLGGGGHRTGHKGGGWELLRSLSKRWFPGAQEVAHWATQDCVTLDGGAYVGQYSPRTPDLFVSTGFNKWGWTTAMAGAEILCDLLQGKANLYAPAFDPSRPMPLAAAAGNAAGAAWDLLRPTAPRCPHMGCALRYNPQERSWDCPCHGSRFGEDGRLLDHPAADDLQKAPGRP